MKAEDYFERQKANMRSLWHIGDEQKKMIILLMKEYAALNKTNGITWVALAESYPKPESKLIMYREDAGVFFGYYGSLEESVPDDQKEHLYEQGLTEEDIFENRFYYYDMAGNGLLELDTLPKFWAECPKPPCI